MKKLIAAFVVLFLAAVTVQAQEDGAKMAKKARRALTSYNIEPSGNSGKLDEAKQLIEDALKLPDAQADASAWIIKGDIYSKLLQRDQTRRLLDPNAPLSGDNDALVAFEAYQKGHELAQKSYEKKDAIKGITPLQGDLTNVGISKFEKQEYGKAYQSFLAVLKSHDLLLAAGEKSILADDAQYNEQVYYTALSAMLDKNCGNALPLLEQLYKKGTDKPAIYEGIYNCKLETGDVAGAEKVLAEGRKKFPEDSGLLFAEINAYLKAGKLDELTDRLKQAIKQEPNNIGLYVTLGNVYDNLYQMQLKAKNDAKATEYFNEAKSNYDQAVARDPKNVDANYALGALYYNKAAFLTQELNDAPEDFSSAGLKKMEAARNNILALFDQALPYFQKAEGLNPNDANTLIALTEIYARKEDELSLEFKKRLETVRGGGKNASSYFKQ